MTFPEIPEAITAGASEAEAIGLAQDALQTALEFYFSDKRQIPLPSGVEPGQVPIALPARVAAKILLDS